MRLITTKDLADRWAMSESEIKCLVRGDSSLPFVRLGGGGDMRVNWRRVRFRLDAIERWEEDHQQAFIKKPEQSFVMPARSLLGDWRSKIKKTASR